jgi:hypothetical protein
VTPVLRAEWAGRELKDKIVRCPRAERSNPGRRETEETLAMTTVPITFHVDPEAAKAYESMTAEERNKIEAVLRLRLRGLLVPTGITLRQALDELGREAEGNGLTPEILESLLSEETSSVAV